MYTYIHVYMINNISYKDDTFSSSKKKNKNYIGCECCHSVLSPVHCVNICKNMNYSVPKSFQTWICIVHSSDFKIYCEPRDMHNFQVLVQQILKLVALRKAEGMSVIVDLFLNQVKKVNYFLKNHSKYSHKTSISIYVQISFYKSFLVSNALYYNFVKKTSTVNVYTSSPYFITDTGYQVSWFSSINSHI